MQALWPVAAVLLGLCLYAAWRRWRDHRVSQRPFPEDWLAFLKHSLPIYDQLTEAEQQRLRQLVQRFIAQKRFYGCAGLEITDEIRVAVAGQACLLLLHRKTRLYPKLQSILVYPSAFRVARAESQSDGTVSEAGRDLAGESWSNGKVILSWDHVTSGVQDFTDGQNVVMHEFAHQLDSQSGSTNGAPPLYHNSYRTWATVFEDNFKGLRERTRRGRHTVMDSYGTLNPAEFFAVATETFFEQPHALQERRPDLYAQLQTYYQVDPRSWHAESAKR